jgi:hypothetical protein
MFGDHDDDHLVGELRELLDATDPPPATLVEAAKASYGWRTIDAELAALAYDSASEPAPAGVRGGAEPRLVVFDGADVRLEIELHADGPERRLLGQLVPPGPAELEVRQGGGRRVKVSADASGRFAAAGLTAEALSLACLRPGQPPVVTDWILP